jgi:hypothetical protein
MSGLNLNENINVVLFPPPKLKKNLLRDFSPQANYTTERPPLVGEVSANFCE